VPSAPSPTTFFLVANKAVVVVLMEVPRVAWEAWRPDYWVGVSTALRDMAAAEAGMEEVEAVDFWELLLVSLGLC